jgi:glycosyltransferase involved in cell wall biosynthesis
MTLSMPRIAIAHDYLTQFGGAERVVAAWAQLFPDAPIYTMAYAPQHTFVDFLDRKVTLPSFGSNRFFANAVPAFLPVLPRVAASIRITETVDWVLASTSGFAHGFRADVPIVAYCHSPARWLYETDDYQRGLGPLHRAALRGMSGYLRRADQTAAARVTTYIANSAVTRARIRRAYGIDAPIVHPPVGLRVVPVPRSGYDLPEVFALCIARSRGYKNLVLAAEAAHIAGVPLVAVGEGTESISDRSRRTIGLGRVSDAQLAALYAEATVLVGVAHEDFGLTPVEAAQAGTPTVAIARGGYLETVLPGLNGLLVEELASDVADGLKQAIAHDWDAAAIRTSAERFTPEAHRTSLLRAAEEVVIR